MFDWGFVIPKELINDFCMGISLPVGKSRDVVLLWNKKEYIVKISHINRKKSTPVFQIRWDSSRQFLNRFREVFIQSYVILKSQKELFDASKHSQKHFRTKLPGGNQEVVVFTPYKNNYIKVDTYITIENEWNTLFRRLANENVFGWIFEKNDKKYLIQRSTNWINVKDFKKHQNAINVIYYLVNSKKKLLYIGKAEVLGKRVKPGRKHQNMPGDWDLFKYDIVRPEFSDILDRVEDHTIRSLASFMMNNHNYSSVEISNYTIVNSKWKKL